MARIEYLSELEIKKFEKAPEFENNIERNYYFTLPSSIHKQALSLWKRSIISRFFNSCFAFLNSSVGSYLYSFKSTYFFITKIIATKITTTTNVATRITLVILFFLFMMFSSNLPKVD